MIFHTSIAFEILFSKCGKKMLDAAAAKAIRNATVAVCHRSIVYPGLFNWAVPRTKLAAMKLFVAPIANIPVN